MTPVVPLEAAEPEQEFALDAVAAALVQPEYVYFWRVVLALPIANIPTVALPAAAAPNDPAPDAVATAFVLLE